MKYFFLINLFWLGACTRTIIKNPEEAMRLTSNPPALVDTLSRESFFNTLRSHIEVMKSSSFVSDPMIFGEKKISKATYLSSLQSILEHEQDWIEWIEQQFDLHEVYGRESWGEILSTGYYEPLVKGSHSETPKYSQPAYAFPPDLVTIDLKSFAYKFSRGVEFSSLQGRLDGQRIIPYYVRKEIDTDKKLKGKNLELVWLNPIDAFFIQIQGSGMVELENGEKMRIGYAGQNGHPYVAIGKQLEKFIPLKEMSMQKIRAHLETLSTAQQQEIFNTNPSYVFFKPLETLAKTYTGADVSEGRTIATDKHLLPKGALAFLDIEEPEFQTLSSTEPIGWIRRPRLVFDQDTGGAIKGPGRVDLYFGQGEEAAQKAGVMRRLGKLYYLVPKNKK